MNQQLNKTTKNRNEKSIGKGKLMEKEEKMSTHGCTLRVTGQKNFQKLDDRGSKSSL